MREQVLVVGGGPAGAAAAIACAQAGLRVRIVEREGEGERTEQDKPGEGLHPGVEAVLRELGVSNRLAGVTHARFAGVWVGWGEAPRFDAFGADEMGPWLGYQVCRRAFDAVLRERARELGADVLQAETAHDPIVEGGAVVGVNITSGTLRAALVIDATGPARWLARKLELPCRECSPRQAVRYGYVRGVCKARDDAPALIGDHSGWIWTARVGDGLYQWVRLDLNGARTARDWRPAEYSGLERVGVPRGADATWRVTQAAGPGWLLAGDAAASLDPTSSKGVLKALLSGLMAGRTAVAILQRGAPAAQGAAAYRRWLEKWFDADVAALAPMYARLAASGYG